MEQLYDVKPTDTLHNSLDFAAFSAVVQNNTGQWFYCPTANAYISPYTINAIVTFPAGTQVAELVPMTPVNQQSLPVTGELLHIRYTDDKGLSNSSGVTLGYGSTFQNMGGSAVFVVAVPGSLVNFPIGFLAYSVQISNISGQWYQYSNSRVIIPIPPYTSNVVIPVSPPESTFNIQAITPPGQQSNPKTGEILYLNAYATTQPAQQGVNLSSPIINNPPPINITTFFFVANLTGLNVFTVIPSVPNFKLRIVAYSFTITVIPTVAVGPFGQIAAFADFGGSLGQFFFVKHANSLDYEPTQFALANDSGLFQSTSAGQALLLQCPAVAGGWQADICGQVSYVLVP